MQLVSSRNPARRPRRRVRLLALPPGDLQARQDVLIANQWRLLQMLTARGQPIRVALEALDALQAITLPGR